MQFNFGAGIAAGAKAAATTYENVSMEERKAELENEKLKLADSLAGAREEKMAGIKHGYDVSLLHEQTAGQKEVVGAEATARTQSAKDIAQDVEDREQRLLKDPNYIAGLKRKEQAISSGNIAQVAAANASNIQARAAQLKLDTDQKTQKLQSDLAGETDPQKRDAIQRKIVDLSTDANSIVATQTASQAEFRNDITALSALDTRLTAARTQLSALQTAGAPQEQLDSTQSTIDSLEKQANTQSSFLAMTMRKAHGVTLPPPVPTDRTQMKNGQQYSDPQGNVGVYDAKTGKLYPVGVTPGTGKPLGGGGIITPAKEDANAPKFDTLEDWTKALNKEIDKATEGANPYERKIITENVTDEFTKVNPRKSKALYNWEQRYLRVITEAEKGKTNEEALRASAAVAGRKFLKDNPMPPG